MIAWLLLLSGLDTPDATAALTTVQTCDRAGLRRMIGAEPHRRTEFAAAVYAEQRAIAEDRANLVKALPTGALAGSDAAPPPPASLSSQIDARQKALEDARATEKSWRDLFDQVRADFLANCSSGKLADR